MVYTGKLGADTPSLDMLKTTLIKQFVNAGSAQAALTMAASMAQNFANLLSSAVKSGKYDTTTQAQAQAAVDRLNLITPALEAAWMDIHNPVYNAGWEGLNAVLASVQDSLTTISAAPLTSGASAGGASTPLSDRKPDYLKLALIAGGAFIAYKALA